MKKFLALATVLALLLSMTVFVNANVYSLHVESAAGTAVIDGEKDSAYDSAVTLKFDQSGKTNGGGAVLDEPEAYGYVINDDEYVYIFIDVIDDDVDDSSANRYERDSVEVYYMEDNKYQQIRFHIDGHADETKSTGYVPADEEWELVLTDTGYAFECRIPITDVKDNEIEMCLQINSCSNGYRQRCVYISGNTDGDEACTRTTRQDQGDGWWTLELVGEFGDTRVDPVEEADEITVRNYEELKATQFHVQLYTQDLVDWSWTTVGSYLSSTLGQTITDSRTQMELLFPTFTADNTKDWTSAPYFSIQVGCAGTMAAGDKAHYTFTVSDITIEADGYDTIVIPSQELDCNWVGVEESWGVSGTDVSIELGDTIRTELGLSVEQFCNEYLPAITNVSYDVTFESYNQITLADIEAFEETLADVEQEWLETDETFLAQIEKAETALASAQASPEDADALADALKDANAAYNRANKAIEDAGWSEGGIAYTYLDETIGGAVNEIQATIDALAGDEGLTVEPEDESADDVELESESKEASTSASSTSEVLVVGIVIGVIVIAVAIIAVILVVAHIKKKKQA